MQKTIHLDETTSLTLDSNVGWLMEYRAQFGRDIMPAIMPAISAIGQLIFQLYANGEKLSTDSVLEALDEAMISDALTELAGLEVVDLLNITWAMAKTADDSIPEPLQWVRQFDAFPVDVVAPEVFRLVAQSCVSSKNWNRLRAMLPEKK